MWLSLLSVIGMVVTLIWGSAYVEFRESGDWREKVVFCSVILLEAG